MPLIEQVMGAAEYSPEEHIPLLPLYATPKIDGIRFYIKAGRVWTRSNKPLPNKALRLLLPCILPEGTDGEITASEPSDPEAFQKATSLCMGVFSDITPTRIHVFDYLNPELPTARPYSERVAEIQHWFQTRTAVTLSDGLVRPPAEPGWSGAIKFITSISSLEQHLSLTRQQVFETLKRLRQSVTILQPTALRKPHHPEKFLSTCLAQGYEGIMLRLPSGGYKFGRSTSKEALLLKYKPWSDSEAVITGFEELMHNENEQFESETGKSKRSSAAFGKRPGNTLGAFLVSELKSDGTRMEFSVGGGPGLSKALRQEVWNNRQAFLGRLLKYRYLATGTKVDGKPRMPQFCGFRDERDLD
jgi:DNA ligase-1